MLFPRKNIRWGAVGPTNGGDGTTPATGRQGKTGEAIVGKAHGDDYEAASRGVLFCAGDQGAGITVQVTVTTTATLTLHNPAGSKKRLAIRELSIAYFNGTLGAGAFYHGFNPIGTTLPSSGTQLTSYCMNIGNSGVDAAVGVARTGATVVAGTVLYPFASSFPVLATSAVSGPVQCIERVGGKIILEPGAVYQLLGVFGGTGSTPKISAGIVWEEIPVI